MVYKGNIGILLESIYTRDPLPQKIDRVRSEVTLYRKRGTLPTARKLMKKYELKESTATRLLQSIKRTLKERGIAFNVRKTPSANQTRRTLDIKTSDQRTAKVSSPHEYAILQEIRERYSAEIKQHGEQTTIPEGFIYLVTHCLFDGWVKAGMTIDFEVRLATYNIADPLSRFELAVVKWVSNRRKAEKDLLKMLAASASERNGEWFVLDQTLALRIFEGIAANPQNLSHLPCRGV